MKKQDKIDALKRIRKVIRGDDWGSFYVGLCQIIWWHEDFCNFGTENRRKYNFIVKSFPKSRYKINELTTAYVWKPGVKAPRIKWINEQIKKLEGKK